MKELPPVDLAALLAAPVAPLLLDVREPWEVALASIALDGLERRDIPMGQIVQRLGELDPQRPVVCLCHHGMRSSQVAHFLSSRGFAEVWNLSGGIDAWSDQVDPAVPRY